MHSCNCKAYVVFVNGTYLCCHRSLRFSSELYTNRKECPNPAQEQYCSAVCSFALFPQRHSLLLTNNIREHGELAPPAGFHVAQLHIKDFALLGAEECGGTHGGPQLWGHHYPALPAHLHSFDAQLKACNMEAVL